MTTRTNTAMVASTASRERYKIQRFPSGWHGYCGKTRVKEFGNSKADAHAWLDMMNRDELAAAESLDGAHEALFDITGTHFDEDKHECVYNNMSRMWHIYARPAKPARFTKIVIDTEKAHSLPVYGAGLITSAYLLDDGCVVGYCKETKEWLKWNAKGQLHNSCGKTREDAALLFNDDEVGWCNNNMVENAKIIAEARTKPTHSERVRAISARRDARRAKRRSANEELQHEVKVVRHQLGCAQRTAAHRLDQIVKQQNYRARYVNVTLINSEGSPIHFQQWCADEDDVSAVETRICNFTKPDEENWHGVIIRVFIFDTFTKQLHECTLEDGKLVQSGVPRKEVLS